MAGKTRVRVKTQKEPDPEEVVSIRSAILKTLLKIDEYASKDPSRVVSIRNRTRESITRLLHYERDLEKLTRMDADASKLLVMWSTSN